MVVGHQNEGVRLGGKDSLCFFTGDLEFPQASGKRCMVCVVLGPKFIREIRCQFKVKVIATQVGVPSRGRLEFWFLDGHDADVEVSATKIVHHDGVGLFISTPLEAISQGGCCRLTD